MCFLKKNSTFLRIAQRICCYLYTFRVIEAETSSMLCSSFEGGTKEMSSISSIVTLCLVYGDAGVS